MSVTQVIILLSLLYVHETKAGCCITNCTGESDGDYQSCIGCNVYATCSNDVIYDNRPCPAGLFWDDSSKRCEWTSTTCPCAVTPAPTTPAPTTPAPTTPNPTTPNPTTPAPTTPAPTTPNPTTPAPIHLTSATTDSDDSDSSSWSDNSNDSDDSDSSSWDDNSDDSDDGSILMMALASHPNVDGNHLRNNLRHTIEINLNFRWLCLITGICTVLTVLFWIYQCRADKFQPDTKNDIEK
eukprot:552595_1